MMLVVIWVPCSRSSAALRREVPRAFATDHQVAIALCLQPRQVRLGGQATVHDDQGTGRGLQTLEHLLQGLTLADIALEDLGTADEAAAVQDQAQGYR